jgi:hypothetical protein
MPLDPTEANVTPPCENRGNIYTLLLRGWYASKIARHLKISRKTVHKWAKFYVKENLIESTGGYPEFYRAKKEDVTPPFDRGQMLPPALVPHHFGATFAIVGKPRIMRKKAWHTVKEHEFTLQIGRYKAILWLHYLAGTTPTEQIEWGRSRALRLAKVLGEKYGCGFTMLQMRPDIEWIMTDKGASKELADKTGIKKNKPIEVASAMFRFDDLSHPKVIEINKAFEKPPEIPTIHAQTLFFLLTKAPQLMEQQIKLTTSITESIVVINQKLETLAQEAKKGKP